MAVLKAFAALSLPALAVAYPQASTGDIPPCAYSAVLASLQSTGCDLTDTACVCAVPNIASTLATSVVAACAGAVTDKDVATFITDYCGSNAPAPAPPPTPAEPTVTADTATPTIVSNATVANATNETWTSPAPIATDSPVPSEGEAALTGMSTMAFAVAIAGMSWIFSEL